MVDTNILVAPPYIHRYTENNQNGWRIQPNGYIKCFLDKDHGGSEAALEVAKGAMRVISTMSNVDLMAIYNPTFRIGIKMTGEMIITMVASRGIHSASRISIPCSVRLGKDTIKSLGNPWVILGLVRKCMSSKRKSFLLGSLLGAGRLLLRLGRKTF